MCQNKLLFTVHLSGACIHDFFSSQTTPGEFKHKLADDRIRNQLINQSIFLSAYLPIYLFLNNIFI